MARENQNQALHVALIIFVTLTVVLGVTTFVFFRQYDHARIRAQDLAAEADRQKATAGSKLAENVELKGMIGAAATAKLEAVRRQFAEDMRACAAGFPQQQRFYRPALISLSAAVRQRNIELVDAKKEIQQLKTKYENRERGTRRQFRRHEEAVQRAGEDLLFVQSAAREDQKRNSAEKTRLRQDVAEMQQKADLTVAELEKQLATLSQRYRETWQQLDDLKEATRPRQRKVPQGRIRTVSQRTRTVWIDLGWDDALRRLVPFGVYPPGSTRLADAGGKALVEVTKITGAHDAEAKIVEDRITDPIIPGDVIYSPTWSPERPD